MSLNFDYPTVPTKTNKSLGYIYGEKNMMIDYGVPNLSNTGVTTFYSFGNVVPGVYMFILKGWMRVNETNRYLTIEMNNTTASSNYGTITQVVYSTLNPDIGNIIPIWAGTVLTQLYEKPYTIYLTANGLTTGCKYNGSIQLVRIA